MSRKPVDKQQPTECRQAVWNEIKKQGIKLFSIVDIARAVDLGESTVGDYIRGLARGGYLEKRGEHYVMINDVGVDAPRVRKDGARVTQGIGREQLWNTMRILKMFTVSQLAFNSSTDDHKVMESEAKSYCFALCRAGYLSKISPNHYALIFTKWSGPKSPQIQKTKQVYDANLKKVVWSTITEGAI